MVQLYRAQGILDLARVQHFSLLVLGLGSLGSKYVEELAFPWNRLILVDPELLERENVERHLLGVSQVGRPKVDGVRDWLLDRGLAASSITTIVGTSLASLNPDQIDLVIVAVDNLPARKQIDAWCRQHSLPAIYGGVYPQGTGGHTVYVPTPQDICYGCASAHLGEQSYQGKTGDYGVDPSQLVDHTGELKAVPALKPAVTAIANDMARLTLQIVNGDVLPAHILIDALKQEAVFEGLDSTAAAAVTNFGLTLSRLGAQPNFSLSLGTSGTYSLHIRNSRMVQALHRWDHCPYHSSTATLLSDF